MLIIPEFILETYLTSLLKFVRDDYNDNISTPELSWLYKLLGTNTKKQRFNFLEQAVKIFVENDKDSTRFLEVSIGFNAQRNSPPNLYINMPSESAALNSLGNGIDSEMLYDEDNSNQTFLLNNRQSAVYDIVITSDNHTEVVLIYFIVRALLKSSIVPLEMSGLQNVKFSGADLNPYNNISPQLYTRALRLALEYTEQIPSQEVVKYLTTINFESTLKNS